MTLITWNAFPSRIRAWFDFADPIADDSGVFVARVAHGPYRLEELKRETGLDEGDLVALVVAESWAKGDHVFTDAVSPKGAVGIAQIRLSTARAVRLGTTVEDLKDPRIAIPIAVGVLRRMSKELDEGLRKRGLTDAEIAALKENGGSRGERPPRQ